MAPISGRFPERGRHKPLPPNRRHRSRSLTARHWWRPVIELLPGNTYYAIGRELGISESYVKNIVREMKLDSGAKHKTELWLLWSAGLWSTELPHKGV